MGRIGFHLARISTGLGMRVIGSDIDPTARRAAEEVGVEMTTTDDLLERAEAVAVCASTDPDQPTILDAHRVHRLRHGSFLVNVGRPGLVDTEAVVDAIHAARLRGYAVDDVVLDPAVHADLLTEGRVLQTSHSAWWRDEVLQRGAEHFGRALLATLAGHPRDVVTRSERHAAPVGPTSKERVA